MSTDVAIRPAVLQDAAGIARVHVRSWDESYRGIVPDSAIDVYTFERRNAAWNKWLKRDGWTTFVAESESQIIGFTCAFPDATEPGFDTFLNTLYVLQSAQRRGIARQLLRVIAASSIERGRRAIWWLTLRENPACAFYERIGATVLRDQPAPPELGEGIMDRVFGIRDLRVLL